MYSVNTQDRPQSIMLILSMNVDLRSLETEFLIAVCRQMAIENTVSSDLRSWIFQSIFDCPQPGMIKERILWLLK